jgi:NAD(P)H-hydrate epimerase
VSGSPAVLIDHLNASGATIISIDVPSGLFCDATTTPPSGGVVVHATHTLTFAPPKLAFFFPENQVNVGTWHLLDIGLSKEFIRSAAVDNFMVETCDVVPMLRTRKKFDHKGNFGHALLIAGSTGKMGAAVLAARASLRAGTGLLTCAVPRSGLSILQTSVPEAMVIPDPSDHEISAIPDLSGFTAIGIGPGTGTSPGTANAVKMLIQQATHPIVFDADALNILAENRTWLAFMPKGSVLTPHPREFERLAGKSKDNFDRHRLQREFSARYQCFVVLKGAHTVTTTPDGLSFFNTTGNPGMATGGSGDVLTGILTGLMAQGYSSLEACLLGVFIHGMAGDIALKEQGYEALIAGDIINNLGKTFQTLYGKF